MNGIKPFDRTRGTSRTTASSSKEETAKANSKERMEDAGLSSLQDPLDGYLEERPEDEFTDKKSPVLREFKKLTPLKQDVFLRELKQLAKSAPKKEAQLKKLASELSKHCQKEVDGSKGGKSESLANAAFMGNLASTGLGKELKKWENSGDFRRPDERMERVHVPSQEEKLAEAEQSYRDAQLTPTPQSESIPTQQPGPPTGHQVGQDPFARGGPNVAGQGPNNPVPNNGISYTPPQSPNGHQVGQDPFARGGPNVAAQGPNNPVPNDGISYTPPQSPNGHQVGQDPFAGNIPNPAQPPQQQPTPPSGEDYVPGGPQIASPKPKVSGFSKFQNAVGKPTQGLADATGMGAGEAAVVLGVGVGVLFKAVTMGLTQKNIKGAETQLQRFCDSKNEIETAFLKQTGQESLMEAKAKDIGDLRKTLDSSGSPLGVTDDGHIHFNKSTLSKTNRALSRVLLRSKFLQPEIRSQLKEKAQKYASQDLKGAPVWDSRKRDIFLMRTCKKLELGQQMSEFEQAYVNDALALVNEANKNNTLVQSDKAKGLGDSFFQAIDSFEHCKCEVDGHLSIDQDSAWETLAPECESRKPVDYSDPEFKDFLGNIDWHSPDTSKDDGLLPKKNIFRVMALLSTNIDQVSPQDREAFQQERSDLANSKNTLAMLSSLGVSKDDVLDVNFNLETSAMQEQAKLNEAQATEALQQTDETGEARERTWTVSEPKEQKVGAFKRAMANAGKFFEKAARTADLLRKNLVPISYHQSSSQSTRTAIERTVVSAAIIAGTAGIAGSAVGLLGIKMATSAAYGAMSGFEVTQTAQKDYLNAEVRTMMAGLDAMFSPTQSDGATNATSGGTQGFAEDVEESILYDEPLEQQPLGNDEPAMVINTEPEFTGDTGGNLEQTQQNSGTIAYTTTSKPSAPHLETKETSSALPLNTDETATATSSSPPLANTIAFKSPEGVKETGPMTRGETIAEKPSSTTVQDLKDPNKATFAATSNTYATNTEFNTDQQYTEASLPQKPNNTVAFDPNSTRPTDQSRQTGSSDAESKMFSGTAKSDNRLNGTHN